MASKQIVGGVRQGVRQLSLSSRYRDLEVLWEDGERVVSRGWMLDDEGSQSAVLVVVPAVEHGPSDVIDRLAHEYALRDVLGDAPAMRPLALQRDGGRTALVLEDAGGEPLVRLLGSPMEMGRFLRLAIAVSAALGKVHQCGLVHKDIKPGNILVDPVSGEVRLTGFGIASRLTRERQVPEPPETIAGTLAYMAPEQTGRMNRSIDSRSDLYALGVSLCEMLTGSLPFTATDPIGWVHCHIAKSPVLPNERLKEIPAPVSAIIMKLLAKTAEERYQTAGGVERDLTRCLAEWEARGSIDDFPLGQQGTPDRLLIPEKLYGREREVGTLIAAFDRVVDGGPPELVLVSGYSGIGKSSVVNELHTVLVPTRGQFASGKFDQYKRDIPYSTLAQAFQGLVRPLLGKSDAELASWRDAFLEALDQNGQLMVDLVPDLKLIIGDQPPVPELPPQQAQNRFQLVFRRFIGVFARPEHPLALFLDDLQWLDAATLDLIEDLLIRSDLQHLILIGAYRDNEIDAAHPLARKLVSMRSAGANVQEIALAPLASEHLGQLTADALRCPAERAAPLAQLVHGRTGGNPFFAIQFLSALADEGLLRFDHDMAHWSWDLERIHAKGYTDNVVGLMVGKLARLPAETLRAVQQLACVGGSADIAMLSIAFGMSEEQVHADLWEAVRQELVERLKGSYKFVHDRVHEAAYSLIPEPARAPAHLHIGRLLAAQTLPERQQETIFEIVNQLNRGVTLIADRDERERLAAFNLIAGRRAKRAAAYASACTYLRSGMRLIGSEGWTRSYELALGLWLEGAECECLSGNLDEAERLIGEVLARGTSKIDKAAVYRLKVDVHVLKSENKEAVESALECLRLFGIAISPHPLPEDVEAEYRKVWSTLGERSIESLIDLPLMTDVEMQAAMRVLSVLFAPAYYTDINLAHLHLCHMVNLTLRYGTTDASAHAYAWFGLILGPRFRRFEDGYRFGRLACDLVEKHDLTAYRAKTNFTMEMVTLWTQPVQTGIDYIRTAFRAGVESGDITVACYACNHLVTDLLLRGDPLEDAWRELERGLDFARKAKFRDVADIIVSQQRFILTMRGQTTNFSTFSDAAFDEHAFEAELTTDRMPTMVCWYWVLKVQARFFSEDYDQALAASRKAKRLLWSSDSHIQLLDYYYYTALAITAAYDTVTADAQVAWCEELAICLSRLQEWSESCSATFRDKHALVEAEMARLEGRDLDAQRRYEEAISSARASGFVHNEALANELAARFYTARGFEQIADLYLRNARRCYARWGADGKVRQLDQAYPHLRMQEAAPAPTSTMGVPVEHLDLATVIRVSQAVSGEMVLEKLLDTVMRTALEQAGAVRGLLILSRGAEPRIVAEAAISGDAVIVRLPDEPASREALPLSVLQYVLRTRESVMLDDASDKTQFSADPYIRENYARSVLCAPLVNQGKLIGGLYLENNLAARVFVPSRTAVLKLLASQAAISLENTRLYRDLELREARIRRLVDANIMGIFMWDLGGDILEANDAFLRLVGYDRKDLDTGRLRWPELNPPELGDSRKLPWITELRATGSVHPFEKVCIRKDGSRVPVLLALAIFEDNADQGVAFVLDLSERKRAEAEARESDRRYREMQGELSRAMRLASLGEFAGSIVHEVSQPLGAMMTSADAALRWLSRDPPALEEARASLARATKQGQRSANVIAGMRLLIRNESLNPTTLNINDVVQEMLELVRLDLERANVTLCLDLDQDLPTISADRVQLRQVFHNLVRNAIDSMSLASDMAHVLTVATQNSGVLAQLMVKDTGGGFDAETHAKLFTPLFSTKETGMGLGLAICRRIVAAHGGRMWAQSPGRGASFFVELPCHHAGERT
jgi:PAS domain S-box-containing protein